MAVTDIPAGLSGSKFQAGDLFSAKSSASANPVSTLQFTPVLSVITGSPNASMQGSPGASSDPSITAPITETREQRGELGDGPPNLLDGFSRPSTISGPSTVPGRSGGAVQAGILGGDTAKIAFLAVAAFLFYKLISQYAGG